MNHDFSLEVFAEMTSFLAFFAIFLLFFAGFRFQGRFAIAYSNTHEGGQALQMYSMQQSLRQFQLPLTAYKDTFGDQTLQVSTLLHFVMKLLCVCGIRNNFRSIRNNFRKIDDVKRARDRFLSSFENLSRLSFILSLV